MQLGVTVAHARVHYGDTPTLGQYGQFVEWAAGMKFAGVELAAFTLDHFARDFRNVDALRKLGDRCRSLGLTVNAFEAGYLRNMPLSPEPAVRQQATRALEEAVAVAQTLNSDLVYFHSAPHPSWTIEFKRLYDDFSPPVHVDIPPAFSWDDAWKEYVAAIQGFTRIAERAKVRLAMEIRPYEMVTNADGMRRLVDAVGSSALGLVFDTAHFLVQKELLPVAIEKLKDRIYLVHLADNDGLSDYHWAPGKGTVPWDSVLHALHKIGYGGFANIDVAGTYDDIDAEIRSGRDYILKQMTAVTP
jgi:sugar phosphate isomerase/epimerase